MVTARTNPEDVGRVRTAAGALEITTADLAGVVLRRLATIHRRQELRIFRSQGAEGAFGRWPPLSPAYAEWKRRVVGNKPILVFTGETRERFTKARNPEHIAEFHGTPTAGFYRFGARSDKAWKHVAGIGVPVRDMITKTEAQEDELRRGIVDWYRRERLPAVIRAIGLSIRGRPR